MYHFRCLSLPELDLASFRPANLTAVVGFTNDSQREYWPGDQSNGDRRPNRRMNIFAFPDKRDRIPSIAPDDVHPLDFKKQPFKVKGCEGLRTG